ncbi:MAG: glycosyltransferase family 4 protein [Elusimicrobia bacterium]|nr:glycosyltransferase family 4 protein [Elusimicrobiota bacterium]
MKKRVASARLCLLGPLLGANPGWVTSQGEVLEELLSRDGFSVFAASRIPNRFLRLFDMGISLLRWRRDVDVVVLLVFSGPAFVLADLMSLLAGRILGKPLILALHGGNLPEFAQRHPVWVRQVLSRADVLLAPSRYLSEFFKNWGLDVEVIPNVLELGQYGFHPRRELKPSLLWMRTFHPLYHPELAVEALEILKKTHPGATLTMAGQDKGREAFIKELVRAKGLEGSVRFSGFLNAAAKRREFTAHDIFLNTNRVDNTPVSVLEACASGLPVVATKAPGIAYLLEHEKTGLLVERGDARGLAQAAARLLAEPELAARLSQEGRGLAEKSSWPRVKPLWEELLGRFPHLL